MSTQFPPPGKEFTPLTKEEDIRRQRAEAAAAAAAEPPLPPVKEPVKKEADKKVEMAQVVAFSPIRNPANPDRVFIYRVAPKVHTLSYDQRALHKGVAAPRWNKDPLGDDGVPSTQLQGDSNIVTLLFDDVVSFVSPKERGSKT